MRPPSPTLPLFCLSGLLGLSVLACGLFEDDATDLADITFEEDFTIPVPIDASALCPGDCSGSPVTSPQDRTLMPLNVDVNILSTIDDQANLSQYTGKLKRVRVARIDYSVAGNTLTMDVPALTLYVGPQGSKAPGDPGVLAVGTVPSTPPATNVPKGEGTLEPANTEGVSTLLKTLDGVFIVGALPTVRMGQPFPPSGEADVKITLFVEFVANPIDAATN